MHNNFRYYEEVSSTRTNALFLALTFLFFWLFIWRVKKGKKGHLAMALFCLGLFFLFYAVNYRTLIITLTSESLHLRFGIFSWQVPLDNVEACQLDEVPWLKRFGGAGIHFMSIRKRYRASFNFLEHPRVVIALKEKVGPVQDISFSTCRPEEVLRMIREAISARQIAKTAT